MLPGFRFLLAAIALSISILVFGLGAAALLRAAHEEFASNSSWRAAPEPPMMAQWNEPAKPVLAMLRIDPPQPAQKTSEPQPGTAPASETAALAEPEAVLPPAPDATKVATLNTQDASPAAEPAEAETIRAQAPATSDATPSPSAVAADPPAAAEATKVATIEAGKPSANDPSQIATQPDVAKSDPADTEVTASVPAKPEPPVATTPPAFDPAASDPAAARIATLDGPAVKIEDAPSKKEAGDKAERSAKAQRRAEARAKARRRAALRARIARQQALAQQQAANPFAAAPLPTPARQTTPAI
jgi:hypothetical protein